MPTVSFPTLGINVAFSGVPTPDDIEEVSKHFLPKSALPTTAIDHEPVQESIPDNPFLAPQEYIPVDSQPQEQESIPDNPFLPPQESLPAHSPDFKLPGFGEGTPLPENEPYKTYVGASPEEEGAFDPLFDPGKTRKEISDEEMKVDMQSIDDVIGQRIAGYPQSLSLQHIVTNKNLYKKYPFLRNLKVELREDDNARGSYSEETNTIYLNTNKNTKSEVFKDTLLHEIQHAIQEKEGWARGGSPSVIDPYEISEIKNDPKLKEFEKKMDDMSWDGIDYNSPIFQKIVKAKEDYVKNKLIEKYGENFGYTAYQRLAGEIESRDTASRKDLTLEQRKSQAPYSGQKIPLKDIIVKREGGKSMSEPLLQGEGWGVEAPHITDIKSFLSNVS